MPKNHIPFEKRFWEKVYKTEGCWFWIGSIKGKDRNNYGMIKTEQQANVAAHIASWELHFGVVHTCSCVLHKCDNPQCVNPAHLFLGTHSTNVKDCVNKGRHHPPDNQGIKHGMAKLNEEMVREIKNSKERVVILAEKFGVKPITIYMILQGKRWAHVK